MAIIAVVVFLAFVALAAVFGTESREGNDWGWARTAMTSLRHTSGSHPRPTELREFAG